jgi:hypothetical protein
MIKCIQGNIMKKGESEMKKILSMIMFFAWVALARSPAAAEVSVRVGINIPLPPVISFSVPPEVVVIPETYVYFVPDVEAEIFFFAGWWWRPWEGRWYRSRYYDRDWAYHDRAPSFYSQIPPGWRNDYRERRWKDHRWEQRRVPHGEMQKNWRSWQKNNYWEKENHWGLRGPTARKQPMRSVPQNHRRDPARSRDSGNDPRGPSQERSGRSRGGVGMNKGGKAAGKTAEGSGSICRPYHRKTAPALRGLSFFVIIIKSLSLNENIL